MSPIEINAIRHRGAKARSLGISYFSNPFLFKEMLPAATGESAETWGQKACAWWEGWEIEDCLRRNGVASR